MSYGSAGCTSTIPITVPAVRFVAADWATPSWRAFACSALARALYFVERRRQRLALAELDDRPLAEIGVSRADAVTEVRKPFWR
jgi:uncharacterized protein YjiS (DUF1127 family)